MCFFEYISIKHLDEYHASESWRNTLMLFSQTVPSVRHAAIALSLLHRTCLDGDYRDPLKTDKTPLLHYNQAIQLLLDQKTGDSTETTSITLLVCYLFICFDQLARNYVQSIKHLRGGVELSRNIGDAVPTNDNTLIGHVTRHIRRLDMQAVTFLVDWTPGDIPEETLIPQLQAPLPPPNSGLFKFQSFPEAADHLQILVTRVMRLLNFGAPRPHPNPTPTSLPSSQLTAILLSQLQTWSHLFEAMMLPLNSNPPSQDRLPSLLRLHHTISHILLQVHVSSQGPNKEMAYDTYLLDFRHCISLAETIATTSDTNSYTEGPTFTPEVGIIPALYIIGVKCRHPVVRREVLGILRRRERREAVWDSGIAARVVERVVQIEEGAVSGSMVKEMGAIEIGQRVESVSWVHVVEEGRVDVRYAFCGREGPEGVVVESSLV
jgi:hypothetical protein